MLKHCALLIEMVNMEPEKNQAAQQNKPSPAEMNALIALYNAQRYAEVESRMHALLAQYPDTGLLWKLLGASLQMQGKDALPNRIKPHFAAWKPLHGLSDADAARLIHADGAHVLLDLSGHTEQNRLPIFA